MASESGPVIRMRCPANERNTPAQKTASDSWLHLIHRLQRLPFGNRTSLADTM